MARGLAERLKLSGIAVDIESDGASVAHGIRTPDLDGKASTTDFTQSIIRRVNQQAANAN